MAVLNYFLRVHLEAVVSAVALQTMSARGQYDRIALGCGLHHMEAAAMGQRTWASPRDKVSHGKHSFCRLLSADDPGLLAVTRLSLRPFLREWAISNTNTRRGGVVVPVVWVCH
jgi:hypothetical protein